MHSTAVLSAALVTYQRSRREGISLFAASQTVDPSAAVRVAAVKLVEHVEHPDQLEWMREELRYRRHQHLSF